MTPKQAIILNGGNDSSTDNVAFLDSDNTFTGANEFSAVTLAGADLATTLNANLRKFGQGDMYSGGSATSISGASAAKLSTSEFTVNSILAGETIDITWSFSCSGAASGTAYIHIYRGGSSLSDNVMVVNPGAAGAGTGGAVVCVSVRYQDTPGAGNHTYAIYVTSGATTFYSRFGIYTWGLFKQRT